MMQISDRQHMPEVDQAADFIRKLVDDAYNRGLSDGAKSLRAALMAVLDQPSGAASSQVPEKEESEQAGLPANNQNAAASTRSAQHRRTLNEPRGSVATFLQRNLPSMRSATIMRLKVAAEEQGLRFSNDAIGTELRRYEGKRYGRNNDGAWFLLGIAQEEPAGVAQMDAPAGTETQTEGAPNGTPLAE